MTDQHKPPEGDRPPSEYFLDLALSRLAQGETPETAGVWLAGEFRDNGFPLETAIFCGAIGYVPRVCSQNPSATGSEKFYSRDVWEAAVRFEYSQRPQTELPATTAPVTPAASTLQAESAAIPGNALTPSAEFSGQKMEAALTGEAADPDPRQALIANLANIPEVLRQKPNWVLWRFEANGKGGTKVPYIAGPGERRASSTYPQTWRSFDDAHAFFLEHGEKYSGVGFCFEGSGIAGIDLDKVLLVDGGCRPWAQEILNDLNTYCEISPSGCGIHAYVFGSFPGAGKKKKFSDGTGFELYCSGRFFTVTGRHLAGTPLTLNTYHCQALAERGDRGEIGPTVDRVYSTPGRRSTMFAPRANDKVFELAAFLERNAIEVLFGPTKKNGSTFYEITCPWADGNHENARDGRAFVGQLANGALTAGCLHESCSFTNVRGNRWDALRHRYEPRFDPPLSTDADGSTHFRPATTTETSRDAEDYSIPTPDTTPNLLRYMQNDVGNGERLVALHGRDLRYCHAFKKWLAWDGRRWAIDDNDQAQNRAKLMGLEYLRQAIEAHDEKHEKFARGSLDVRHVNNALAIVHHEFHIPDRNLDADPWLLNFQNGTVDLRTGDLRPHRREDFITRLVHHQFNPDAPCLLWMQFLERCMGGGLNADDEAQKRAWEFIGYLQRALGYSLTGVTSEKAVFILFGEGNNGKSTLLTIFRELIKEYATLLQVDTLMTRQESNNTQADLADLRGARFVQTSEAEEGQRLAQGKLKRITQGMGTIKAIRKYENPIEFAESHKLWIDTNRRPMIRDADDRALFNRLHPIPFTVQIPDEEVDKQLPKKLLLEAEGILAWGVQGARFWLESGLRKPQEVDAARENYRVEMDQIGRFIEDRCVQGDGLTVPASALYAEYQNWCEANGVRFIETAIAFGIKLKNRGFNSTHTNKGARYDGIGLPVK
jgi:putative DNA primase/helicase